MLQYNIVQRQERQPTYVHQDGIDMGFIAATMTSKDIFEKLKKKKKDGVQQTRIVITSMQAQIKINEALELLKGSDVKIEEITTKMKDKFGKIIEVQTIIFMRPRPPLPPSPPSPPLLPLYEFNEKTDKKVEWSSTAESIQKDLQDFMNENKPTIRLKYNPQFDSEKVKEATQRFNPIKFEDIKMREKNEKKIGSQTEFNIVIVREFDLLQKSRELIKEEIKVESPIKQNQQIGTYKISKEKTILASVTNSKLPVECEEKKIQQKKKKDQNQKIEEISENKDDHCYLNLRCPQLYEQPCKKSHKYDQKMIDLMQQFEVLRKDYKSQAFCYFQDNGLKLFEFNHIPVNLDNADQSFYYKVTIKKPKSDQDQYFQVEIKEKFEINLQNEQLIIDFYQSKNQLKAQNKNMITEETKVLELSLQSNGKSAKECSQDQNFYQGTINYCNTSNYTFCESDLKPIFLKSQQMSQIIPGCKIIFQFTKSYQSNKQDSRQREIQVYQISYPNLQAKTFYGIITKEENYYIFTSANKKDQKMIILGINQNLKILENNQEIFSANKKSKILEKYLNNYYFEAKFHDWSSLQDKPYCLIKAKIGKVLNKYEQIFYNLNGIIDEKYPDDCEDEIPLIEEIVRNIEISERNIYQEDEKSIILAIDDYNTKCYDDAISIKEIQDKKEEYSIQIHIADVAYLIEQIEQNEQRPSFIDQEAKKRYKTNKFMTMLPSSLCNIFGSLKHSENRFAITLKFNINKKGIIDYESIDYEPSFVNTSKCINYEDADKFLNLDGRKLKYIKGFKKQMKKRYDINEKQFRKIKNSLNLLQIITNNRNILRDQVQGIEKYRHGMIQGSKKIISELKLMAQTTFQFVIQQIQQNAMNLQKRMIQQNESFVKMKLQKALIQEVKQKEQIDLPDVPSDPLKPIQKIEIINNLLKETPSDPLKPNNELEQGSEDQKIDQSLIPHDDAQYNQIGLKQIKDNFDLEDIEKLRIEAQNYEKKLSFIFQDLKTNFKTDTRINILRSFDQLQNQRHSNHVFQQYIDLQKKLSSKFFPLMIKKNELNLEAEFRKIDFNNLKLEKEEEEKIMKQFIDNCINFLESEYDLENKQLNKKDLNNSVLSELSKVAPEMQLKLQCPLRDYSSLLSNKLIYLLLKLKKECVDSENILASNQFLPHTLKQSIIQLRQCIKDVQHHIDQQFQYQYDQNQKGNKTSKFQKVQREIRKMELAIEINNKSLPDLFDAIIIKKTQKEIVTWNSEFQEQSILLPSDDRIKQISLQYELYQEIKIKIKVKSYVPLLFDLTIN